LDKTNRNFKIRYKEYISEIKLKNTAPNLNDTKHGLKNNYNIHFDINIDLNIVNTHNDFYINSVLKELLIHNEIKKKNFIF
jgi:hypothetical protein